MPRRYSQYIDPRTDQEFQNLLLKGIFKRFYRKNEFEIRELMHTGKDDKILEAVKLSMPDGLLVNCENGWDYDSFRSLIRKGLVKLIRPGRRSYLSNSKYKYGTSFQKRRSRIVLAGDG